MVSRSSAAPRVSVIVAVRGNPEALGGLWAALAAQQVEGGFEVVLADNHLRPRIEGVPRGLWPFLVRVVHEPVAGLSRARNTAIGAARGRVLAVTDPDARPRPGWLAALTDALETTGAWCVGGRVEPRFTAGRPAGLAPEVERMFAPPDWPATVEPLRAPWWAAGCNLALRSRPRPRFCEQLGVRGARRLACEDLEITMRAQLSGLGAVIAPEAVVERAVHPGDLTPAALARRAWWHGVSMARLRALHPIAEVYDGYRLADATRALRRGVRPALVELARIAGWHTARLAPALREDTPDAPTTTP